MISVDYKKVPCIATMVYVCLCVWCVNGIDVNMPRGTTFTAPLRIGKAENERITTTNNTFYMMKTAIDWNFKSN